MMCIILFVAYYYLAAMFNIFVRKNNYLFVLLNFLFPESNVNYLVLKNIF
jgi:hypothetical protein